MLQIRLLGGFELLREGRRLAVPPSKRTRALLAYLAVTGRRHNRDQLCDLLWGVPDDPRGALRWSLSKLRPLVDDSDRRRICADRDSVAFDREGSDIDIVAVGEAAATGFERLSTGALEEFAARFAGDFLQGLHLPEQHAFTAWCIAKRDEARRLHIALRRALMEKYGNAPEAALRHARLLSEADPLSESSHALVCRLLRATGRPDEADRQYAASARFLREAGIELNGILEASRTAQPPVSVTAAAREAASVSAAPADAVARPAARPEVATDRKPATVLFAAFAGFRAGDVAAQDPETVLARIDALSQLALPHISALRGEIISAKSDGILAIFGAPLALEDHAARACQAAVDIMKAAGGGPDLSGLCIGLAAGEVIVRAGSGAQAWETLGAVVELAPRVAAAAATGDIVITAPVFKQIEGLFATEAFRSSGEARYRVNAARSVSTRWRARAFRSLARFQGRAVQSATFDRVWGDAQLGRGGIVAVVGDAGIGKSRLIAEKLDRARERVDCKIFETGTSPREAQIMFAPLRPLVHAWLDTAFDTPPDAIEQRLRSRLGRLGQDYTEYFPALCNVLALPVEDPVWLSLGVEQRRQSTIEALVSILLRESEDRPLIVLFEDLHWIDAGSQQFLELLASAIGRAPFLLVLTCRPEYTVPWSNRPNYTQCRLDALSENETCDFLDEVMGADPGLAEIKMKLARHCEGNPLFLEECVRGLIETQVLIGGPGAYTAAKPTADVSTPATVQGILAARIDRLGAARRLVLQAASVIGRSFSSELLATVIERPLAQVREALAELEAAEFVSLARLTPVREYQFVHAVTQQATYTGMLAVRRTALHRAVGVALVRQAGDRVSEIIETVAYHFDTGELWNEASDYRLRAVKRSKEQYAYEVALVHATRAVACARAAQNTACEIETLTLIGDLHSLLGRLDIANESYAAACGLSANDAERRRIGARAHVVRSIVRDGGRIAFYEHGSGSQTLVFVHPFVYGVATFQPLVEQLSSDFLIVTIDPRGTGASDPLPASYTIDDHMLDVIAVLDAATGANPVVAVGISRGALLLIRLAALHASRLTKMILVGSPLRQTVGIDVPIEGTPMFGPEQLMVFAEALRAGNVALALEMFAPTIFSERGTDELRRRFVEHCMQLPPATVVNFFTFDPNADVTNLLEAIDVPTLVVHGSEDLDTPVSTAVELSMRMPRATLHLFEGKGHLPMFTATADFCAVLRAFVATAPEPSKRRVTVARGQSANSRRDSFESGGLLLGSPPKIP